ncbi:hypothetical protein [Chitinophaga sp. LS1]|uniref:hypothetical protein n=1 Tax=Chitinophaga sp. LS1 TaxID=3051176 RepID=UPI002AAAFCEE|nr:hypothetical protein [Chitinophaga sp. LS1]WPV64956.1 hypothetical protein QQL36_24435 [Chitinophaga sp. LS1]
MKKSTNLKRKIKEVKRENVEVAPKAKTTAKKDYDDDQNHLLEGYDESEYDQKDIADEKRKKGA